jgi:RNA-directed DNA polymerase
MTELELGKLIRSAPKRYKVFQIPKRAPHTFRTIAQPAREVKELQRWAIKNILADLPVHSAAKAYRNRLSIADNAMPHASRRFLLKLDFKEFFPSIKGYDFERYIEALQSSIPKEDLKLLSRILFWTPKGERALRLSIGAPSSPLLSNILLYPFDQLVSNLCLPLGVVYTRYADDLSFSADTSVLLKLVEEGVAVICQTLPYPQLALNRSKTVRVSRKDARRVTGLVLTNDNSISLGRDKKRRISATLHHFSRGLLSPEEVSSLKGMMSYINSVEPSFLVRLKQKYGPELFLQLR